jgi:hypothetical protein
MKKQSGFTAVELIYCAYGLALLAGGIGWVWNIVKIVGSDFGQITGLLIIRIIGVFLPPLGAIVGYF